VTDDYDVRSAEAALAAICRRSFHRLTREADARREEVRQMVADLVDVELEQICTAPSCNVTIDRTPSHFGSTTTSPAGIRPGAGQHRGELGWSPRPVRLRSPERSRRRSH
jgi:hypothetical protein